VTGIRSSHPLARGNCPKPASSRVSSLATDRRPDSSLAIDVGERRLPVGVADDEAGVVSSPVQGGGKRRGEGMNRPARRPCFAQKIQTVGRAAAAVPPSYSSHLICQVEGNREINAVFSKAFRVLGQAEVVEPVRISFAAAALMTTIRRATPLPLSIERVEDFGEPAVHRNKQIAGLIPLP
jgi:hypothetical protein